MTALDAPGRFGWLDLAALDASGRHQGVGSITRSGSLLGALAGSIWLLCALLGGPTGSIWLPNECPIDTISKKNRCAAGRPASTLPASLALHRYFMPQT